MGHKVRWSRTAVIDLAGILEYLKTEWPVSVSMNFRDNLKEQIQLITQYPEIGESYEDDGHIVRKILVTRHNALFYEFSNEDIFILRIVDTRSSAYR